MIKREVDLKKFNSFGLPCIAEHFCWVEETAQLLPLLEICNRKSWVPRIIGGGSNVVLPSRLSGCVVLMRNRGIDVTHAASGLLITAAAGENWHNLVRYCIARGYSGIENLALIPGSVGAAPIQNIGAYGVELHSLFVSLRAISIADGSVTEFSRRDCRFSYRQSRFKTDLKDRYLILSVTLRLSNTTPLMLDYPDVREELGHMGVSQPTAASVCEAIIRLRRRKLPGLRKSGNVGSFFKNPIVSEKTMRAVTASLPGLQPVECVRGFKLSAAALIDAAGCKGKRAGGAAVWNRQPLVLINDGDATFENVVTLAETIQQAVLERFKIRLEIEPSFPGISG